jgi:hypothetical protein
MFSLIRAAEDRRLIDQGRVSCPLRERDADVELCLQCTWAREVDPRAKEPFVRCRPPRKLLLLP